ncbi:unnamed protein product, partial [Heterosigma akashiwo]
AGGAVVSVIVAAAAAAAATALTVLMMYYWSQLVQIWRSQPPTKKKSTLCLFLTSKRRWRWCCLLVHNACYLYIMVMKMAIIIDVLVYQQRCEMLLDRNILAEICQLIGPTESP